MTTACLILPDTARKDGSLACNCLANRTLLFLKHAACRALAVRAFSRCCCSLAGGVTWLMYGAFCLHTLRSCSRDSVVCFRHNTTVPFSSLPCFGRRRRAYSACLLVRLAARDGRLLFADGGFWRCWAGLYVGAGHQPTVTACSFEQTCAERDGAAARDAGRRVGPAITGGTATASCLLAFMPDWSCATVRASRRADWRFQLDRWILGGRDLRRFRLRQQRLVKRVPLATRRRRGSGATNGMAACAPLNAENKRRWLAPSVCRDIAFSSVHAALGRFSAVGARQRHRARIGVRQARRRAST